MPVFDQGYQHWKGPLSGHGRRWLTIARNGVRVQTRGRLVRLILLTAWAPSLALVTALALWGLVEQQSSESVLSFARRLLPAELVLEPRHYRAAVWTIAYSVFFKVELFFIMLLAAVAGPGLVSRDLRFNALPLYFSRPLTRADYFLGKLGVIGALVAAVAVGPALFAYAVGVGFSLDLTVVRDTYPVLLASLAFGVVVTLSVGTLLLAMSSLSRHSLYIGIAWAGLWLVGDGVGTMLEEIDREGRREAILREEMTTWVQTHPPPEGLKTDGWHPRLRFDRPNRKWKPDAPAGREREADEWMRGWNRARGRAMGKIQARQAEVSRRDWRTLCSYTDNLDRIAEQLLNTDAAWVTIGRAVERSRKTLASAFNPFADATPVNDRVLADQYVPQYPWQWSAGVLAGLLGISTWTLSRRVRSLDRLK
jgi:hypothetical protein